LTMYSRHSCAGCGWQEGGGASAHARGRECARTARCGRPCAAGTAGVGGARWACGEGRGRRQSAVRCRRAGSTGGRAHSWARRAQHMMQSARTCASSHSHTHTHTHTRARTYTHTHMRAHAHRHTHAHTPGTLARGPARSATSLQHEGAWARTTHTQDRRSRRQRRTCEGAHTLRSARTHTRTHTHTRAHTHTHTHTHTHARACLSGAAALTKHGVDVLVCHRRKAPVACRRVERQQVHAANRICMCACVCVRA
jgi:hypothetical protein